MVMAWLRIGYICPFLVMISLKHRGENPISQRKALFPKVSHKLLYLDHWQVHGQGDGQVQRQYLAVQFSQLFLVIAYRFFDGGVVGALFALERRDGAAAQRLSPRAQAFQLLLGAGALAANLFEQLDLWRRIAIVFQQVIAGGLLTRIGVIIVQVEGLAHAGKVVELTSLGCLLDDLLDVVVEAFAPVFRCFIGGCLFTFVFGWCC